MAKPEIRLKGFEGEWSSAPLSKLALIQKGEQINKNDMLPTGEYYVLNGGISPSGYINRYNCNENTISISEGGNSCGYVAFNIDKFWSGGHNYTLQRLSIDCKYLYSYLKSKESFIMSKRVGSGLPNIQKSAIENIVCYIPPTNKEIEEIGLLNSYYDIIISTVIKQIISLKQIKKANLSLMFPQAGETKPRVRFKGFKSDWVKVSMGEVFIERHEISTITKDFPQLSFTIEEGVIRPEDRKSNKRDFLIKDKTNKKYLITYIDDIIYNPANVIFGAIHKNSLCNGVVSPIYKIFYTNQDASFLECLVRKPEFIQNMTIFMEGTVKKLKTLKPESFLKMEAYIAPSIEEQKLIGRYFHSLDKQISLQEQRLEKLKQIKAACLDKMFV